MRSVTETPDRPGPGQLVLFPGGASSWRGRARSSSSRNLRMAQRLDALAATEERGAAEARRSGDRIGAWQAAERARDARRAAALLRAGPEGVGRILAS